MAPAGSFETLTAAIQAGADSVYFGVEQLNMRAKSTNTFTLDNLSKVVEQCHQNNIKCYITLNTVMYDHDINLVRKILLEAQRTAVDAAIASDIAVMQVAKEISFPIHISTQANVSNIEAVAFYALFSDVVVLARELSLMQVKAISKEITRRDIRGVSGHLMRLEIFCHGALCMAISGKCHMSLHANFSSANRGACIQNCRKKYIVKEADSETEFEVDNEYIMSAKDLCTINFIDKIIDSGTQIIKIEGRGRSVDYVYTTVKCYREAIDSIENGDYSQEKVEIWMEQLETVFNRGFWDGYYLGKKMGEWSDSDGSKATKRKVFLGKGIKYYEQQKVAEFKIEAQHINVGDEIIISGPTTGYLAMSIGKMRVDNQSTEKAKAGDSITFECETKIRPSDKLYKLISVQ